MLADTSDFVLVAYYTKGGHEVGKFKRIVSTQQSAVLKKNAFKIL